MSSNDDGESTPVRATMDGADASVTVGGAGIGGDIDVRDAGATSRVEVDGDTGSIAFKNDEGQTTVEYRGDRGAFVVGGSGAAGSVLLRDESSTVAGEIAAEDGALTVYSADGTPALTIAADGTVRTAKPIQEGGDPGEGRGRGGDDDRGQGQGEGR